MKFTTTSGSVYQLENTTPGEAPGLFVGGILVDGDDQVVYGGSVKVAFVAPGTSALIVHEDGSSTFTSPVLPDENPTVNLQPLFERPKVDLDVVTASGDTFELRAVIHEHGGNYRVGSLSTPSVPRKRMLATSALVPGYGGLLYLLTGDTIMLPADFEIRTFERATTL